MPELPRQSNSEPVTHIAGPDITIEGRYLRQRCAWCGAVLLDYDLTLVAVPADQPGPLATWPLGAFVRVHAGVKEVLERSDPATPLDRHLGPRLPAGACALMDPAVTR